MQEIKEIAKGILKISSFYHLSKNLYKTLIRLVGPKSDPLTKTKYRFMHRIPRPFDRCLL